jgi:hypothetical protein
VLYLQLIILLVGGDVPVDSETLLVINFVNLKIKTTQSFVCAHRSKVCMHVFIGVITRVCMSICVCTVFLKKIDTRVMYQGILISYTNAEYADDSFIRRSYIYDWNMHNFLSP